MAAERRHDAPAARQQALDRARDDDVRWAGVPEQPRGDVDRHPGHVGAPHLHGPRVHADAHFECSRAIAAMVAAAKSIAVSGVEEREEAVAGELDLLAAEAAQLAADDA